MAAVLRGIPRLLAILLALGSISWIDRPAMAQAAARGGSRFIPNDSGDAEELLKNAANHARDGQWAETLDLYQRVIDRFGERVARVPKGEPGVEPTDDFVLYMDARRFCHRRIAQMPPEARAIYRKRIDALAGRWYREGSERRDEALLRRVVDQAFCSAWGDDALELLGDLAFQDGRFDEAMATYGRLVPDRPDDPFALVHPDPDVDLARVAAKKWLCLAASGRPPGPDGLKDYARRYPGAEGTLAGRKGPYPTILSEAIAGDRLAMPDQADGALANVRRRRRGPGSRRDRSTSARCSGGSSWRRCRRRSAAPRRIGGRRRRRRGVPTCWRSTRSSWGTRCWSATARPWGPTISAIARSARRGRRGR